MALTFIMLSSAELAPTEPRNTVYLLPDNWDDFHYKTLFNLVVIDQDGQEHEIGNLKIGFSNQEFGYTKEHIETTFTSLPKHFFSLGQNPDYYKNIIDLLPEEMAENLLKSLRDIVEEPSILPTIRNESVFTTSLLRTVHGSSIKEQFHRILRRQAPLTNYDFFYKKVTDDDYSGIKVEFSVAPESKPSSNIHILIGRNGVGKTTLLNNMVNALLPDRGDISETGLFSSNPDPVFTTVSEPPLSPDYFAGVVSVSFSVFDPFEHPENQTEADASIRYHYVGLRKHRTEPEANIKTLKNESELINEFTESLALCFSLSVKKNSWKKAVKKLESDPNFSDINLYLLVGVYDDDESEAKVTFKENAKRLFQRMSSGHAIVLLTITKLVETIEEKTLLLLDEPESHLHPPLLSAFMRALSDLLIDRNGVAIIATHSPVVLQEVPKSCVSILRRTRLIMNVDRPENETFAENVGTLTREVFGLEVSKSGFHELLTASVNEGKSYDEIESEYEGQLGFEGKIILRSLIAIRGSEGELVT